MSEENRKQRPSGTVPWEQENKDSSGPRSPSVDKPDTSNILKKMKSIDKDSGRKYRQRTGQ